jgi:hypothetical protein
MSFPLVVANVFAVFAVIGIFICWGEALTVIIHRRMKLAWRIPLLAGLIASIRLALKGGASPFLVVVSFAVVFVATSMAMSYLYGWVRNREFNEDEAKEGSGRFLPVMYVWTGCVVYVAAIALLNLAVTGTVLPNRVAGF